MQIYLHQLNVVLKAEDIIGALMESTDTELLKLQCLLQKIQSVKKKNPKRRCAHCGKMFPRNKAQKYCDEKCHKLWMKEHPKKKKNGIRVLHEPKQVVTLPESFEREPPIIPAKRRGNDYISLAEGIN